MMQKHPTPPQLRPVPPPACRLRIGALLLAMSLATGAPPLAADDDLAAAVASPARTPAFVARDSWRHPAETLEFFELAPDQHVVEIWPGGGGWYTEILAPYLRQHGRLYTAQFNADSPAKFFRQSRARFEAALAAAPERYDRVVVTTFDPPDHADIAPAGSADRVLTFRNVHNWYMRGGGDARVIAAFEAMYRALKPGGLLGVVDHRLPEARPLSDQEASGYLRQDYVIDMAGRAGFEWVASSEINANPLDTADHPEGVWTLPPTLRLGATDRARYQAIGESDRMTLKFRKPTAASDPS